VAQHGAMPTIAVGWRLAYFLLVTAAAAISFAAPTAAVGRQQGSATVVVG